MSWIDEDIASAVDQTEKLLNDHNIATLHLRIGRGLLAEPIDVLEEAATFSYGLRCSFVRYVMATVVGVPYYRSANDSVI